MLSLLILLQIEARRGGLDMLSSNEESFRLLLESFPRMLLLSVESHVKPMVEFLENIDIPKERMRSIFLLFPPVIFFGTEVLKSRILAFEEVLLLAFTYLYTYMHTQSHKGHLYIIKVI